MINKTIRTASDLFSKIRKHDVVTINFVKADGTKRLMRCTLNFNRIPLSQKPKKVDTTGILTLLHKHGVIHVYDLIKKDWRSVTFNRAEWMESMEENQADRIHYRIITDGR